MATSARRSQQLRSLLRSNGELQLSLTEVDIPAPTADQVVVRVDATPINPSDIGLLFGPADLSTLTVSGTRTAPALTARIPDAAMSALARRVDQPLAVGREGAGVVVEAGASAEAQQLLGRTVALFGLGLYAQYVTVRAADCVELPEGTTAAEGAACFINPLTALGMVETMRREGHQALVHTAAASNLGQMLKRLCAQDGIPLVNVVRRPEQEDLLRSIDAQYVCNSSSSTFVRDLTDTVAATGATLAFDATGGGRLAAQILAAMEAAASRSITTYQPYGSSARKQVYIYGRLDPRPLELTGALGFAWNVGGWLIFNYLGTLTPQTVRDMQRRVVAGVKTIFASRFARTISLAEVLDPAQVAIYTQRGTGLKFLIAPNPEG